MNKTGFTLIELIVTLFIFGILLAISLPGYQQFMIKSRRTEAHAALINTAMMMESWYATHHTYEKADLTDNPAFHIPKNRWYAVEITEQSQDRFTLRAVPLHSQAQDRQCQTLTLNYLNLKGIAPGAAGAPTGKIGDCWG